MAGPAGLEPVTSRVTGGCSNQLSYDPMVPERGIAPLTLGLLAPHQNSMHSGSGRWNCTTDLGLMSPTL